MSSEKIRTIAEEDDLARRAEVMALLLAIADIESALAAQSPLKPTVIFGRAALEAVLTHLRDLAEAKDTIEAVKELVLGKDDHDDVPQWKLRRALGVDNG